MSILSKGSCMENLSVETKTHDEEYFCGINHQNSNSKEYYVLIHVEAGETFSVGMGDQVQHIPGPATIRMISNRGPPMPIPMEVPPGHLVQQIVDDDGILTHVIISAYRTLNDAGIDDVKCSFELSGSNDEAYEASETKLSNQSFIPNLNNIEYHVQNFTEISGLNFYDFLYVPNLIIQKSSKLAPLSTGYDSHSQPFYTWPSLASKNRRYNLANDKQRMNRDYSKNLTNVIDPDEKGNNKPDPVVQSKKDLNKLFTPEKVRGAKKAYEANKRLQSLEVTAEKNQKFQKKFSKVRYQVPCDHEVSLKRKDRIKTKANQLTSSHVIKNGKDLSNELKEKNQTYLDSLTQLLSDIGPPEISELKSTSLFIKLHGPKESSDGDEVILNPDQVLYQLFLSENNPDPKTFNSVFRGPTNCISLRDLKPSTNYFIKSCCIYENGNTSLTGRLSETVTFMTESCKPLAAKKFYLVSKNRNSISVKWAAAVDNGSKITDYLLQYAQVSYSQETMPDWKTGYHGNLKSCKLTQLNTQTKYMLRVCAINSHGQGPWSEILTVTTSGSAPQTPTKPRLIHTAVHSLSVAWNTVKKQQSHHQTIPGTNDEIQYILEILDEFMLGDFVTVYQGSASEHCIENLRRNSMYTFRVAAINSDGQSKWSETASYKTNSDVPSPPIGLEIVKEFENGAICLTWSKSEDNGGHPLTRYRLEINMQVDVNSKSTQFLSSCINSNQLHFHQPTESKARKNGKDADHDVIALLKYWPNVTVIYDSPGDLERNTHCPEFCSTLSKDFLQKKWNDRSISADYVAPILCTERLSLSSLSKDLNWPWKKVTQTNPNNLDSDSDNVQAHLDSSQSSESGINTNENVSRAWFIIYEGPYSSVLIENLPRGQEVKFRVRTTSQQCSDHDAKKNAKEWLWSQPSDPVPYTISITKPGIFIEPPSLLALKPKKIHLEWRPPADNGGDEILKYQLIQQDMSVDEHTTDLNRLIDEADEALERVLQKPGLSLVYQGPRTEFCIENLHAGKQYSYTIRAANGFGWTRLSEWITFGTYVCPPDPPQQPPRCHVKSSNQIHVQWDVIKNTNGSSILEYRLELLTKKTSTKDNPNGPTTQQTRSMSDQELAGLESTNQDSDSGGHRPYSEEEDQFEVVYAGPELSYTMHNVRPSTICHFRYCAANHSGASEWSPISTCTTLKSFPEKPTNLSVITNPIKLAISPGDYQSDFQRQPTYKVSWCKSCDNGADITSYQIQLEQLVNEKSLINYIDVPTSHSNAEERVEHNFDFLEPNSKYIMRIRAKNQLGYSDYSDCFKFITPPPLPSKPIIEATKVSSESVRLKWSLPQEANCMTHVPASTFDDDFTNLSNRSTSNIVAQSSNRHFYVLQMLSNRKTASNWQTVYQGYQTCHKISRLKESTEYSFRVLATYSSIPGPYSFPINVLTRKQAPNPCKNPRIVKLTPTSVSLEWPMINMNFSSNQPSNNVDALNGNQNDMETTAICEKDKIYYSIQMVSVKSASSANTTVGGVKSTPWHNSQVTGFDEVYFNTQNRCRLTDLTPGSEYIVRVCAVRIISEKSAQSRSLSSGDEDNGTNDDFEESADENDKSKMKFPHNQILKGPYSQGLLFATPPMVVGANNQEVDSSPKHKPTGVILNPSVTEVLFTKKTLVEEQPLQTNRPLQSVASSKQSGKRILSFPLEWLSSFIFKNNNRTVEHNKHQTTLMSSSNHCNPCSLSHSNSTGRRKSFSDSFKACVLVLIFILVAYTLTKLLELWMLQISVNAKPTSIIDRSGIFK